MNRVKCNLVWNHMLDFEIVQVWFEITSMILEQSCMTWSLITNLLQPFWNCRIQSIPRSSGWFVEKWKQKGFHISFFTWNRNDAIIWSGNCGIYNRCDLEQKIVWLILRANQIAGITSDFKMDIINLVHINLQNITQGMKMKSLEKLE